MQTTTRAALDRWADDGGASATDPAIGLTPAPDDDDGEIARVARRIAAVRAPRVLQIGAFDGRVTRVLAEAAASRGGHVVVVDPMGSHAEDRGAASLLGLSRGARRLERLLETLAEPARSEHDFWENVGARAHAVTLFRDVSSSPALVACPSALLAAFDVVLIDGDHSFEATQRDLDAWASRVVAGGVVFVHDAVSLFAGVRRALAEYATRHDVVVVTREWGSLAVIEIPIAPRPDPALARPDV
jgi:predicted O-methyltransferase YrrM